MKKIFLLLALLQTPTLVVATTIKPPRTDHKGCNVWAVFGCCNCQNDTPKKPAPKKYLLAAVQRMYLDDLLEDRPTSS